MSTDFDLKKLLKDLPPLPGDRKSSSNTDSDDYFEAKEKEKQALRLRQKTGDARSINELEAGLSKIDIIDVKIKSINGQTEKDKAELSRLFLERVKLQCKVLMSGANIPEANAERYYSQLSTIHKTIAGQLPGNTDFLADLLKSINLAYAFYNKSQAEIYSLQFENAIEDGREFFHTTAATELAGKILSCAEKALGLYEQLHDIGTMAVEIGNGYAVYRDSIITSRSSDNASINVRIDTQAYVLHSLLANLIRYSTALQKIEKAKEFNERLEKLDIGYRLKPETDYAPSYKAKLNRICSGYSVPLNSQLSAEISRWYSYWQKGTGSEEASKSEGMSDFSKLLLTAIVVLVVLAFLGSYLL